MTQELQKKIDRAVKLIQSAAKIAEEHGQPLEIAYSGGKDSDVILELARMANVNIRPIYKNTTIDPAGTIKHVKDMGVEILQPKLNFQQIIMKSGFPDRWRRFCCGYLKEYKVLDYAVIGIRRDESRARSQRYHEPEQCRAYKSGGKVRQYMPILDWSKEDVAQFISERGIKCHPLYYDEQGNFHPERRLGCMCCPLQSQRKRLESFKDYPLMLRYYIRGGQEFLRTHPEGKTAKLYNGNVYRWLTATLFCDRQNEFKEKFGPTMFDDGVDCKQYLENYFNIKL